MSFPRSVGWRAVSLLFVASTLCLARPRAAHAAGFELTPEGARANGRAGANYVGGDSPMSLMYNPANIGRDQTTFNAAGSLHFHFNKRCMTPVTVNETETPAGSGNYVRSQGATLSKVCSGGPVTILPELGLSLRLGKRFALGFGVQVPAAAYRDFHFGNPYTGMTDGQPTSTRYLLVREKQLQEFTTIGASYAISPYIRVGASFGWGITTLDYTNTAYSRTILLGGAAVVTADALNRLKATDYFVPRIQFGAWVQPIIDVPIEIGAAFRWTGNIKTKNAKLELHAYNPQLTTILGQLVTLDSLQADGTVSGVGLNVPQTSQLAFGIRYADKLDEPADKVGDRLSTERFDIEGDMAITFGKHVDAFRVDIPDAAQLTANATVTIPLLGQQTIQQMVDLPNYLRLEHKWKTQISVRVGGDINVIPGLLALRAGMDVETNGVKNGYQQLDYMPTTRIGAHLGATVRIAHKVDLSFAYAHIFQPTTNVSYTDAQVRRIATVTNSAAATPPTPTPADTAPVNAGKITNHANVLILAAGAHF